MRTHVQRPIMSVGLIVVALILTSGSLMAFGSKEKTPEQQASDTKKQAISEYNSGVKHMEAARTIGRKGDSIYAYNYRATSDARARKEFEKAVENFQQAITLAPNMPEAYNNLDIRIANLAT